MSKAYNTRNSELAKIHIAKQQLGLDDDTYRQMLWTIARVSSAKDLDHAGRRRVIEHLKSRGWSVHGKPRRPARSVARLMSKIEAQLADMGLPWRYVHSMAKRMFRRDRLEWCNAKELGDIVAALSYEQEKRDLLAQVDAVLQARDLDREYVAGLIAKDFRTYRKDWTRDPKMLSIVLRSLADD